MRGLAYRVDDECERAALAGAQHRERRNDGREDAREEDRHLADRLPAIVVPGADPGPCRPPGAGEHHEEQDVADDILRLLMDTEEPDLPERPDPRQNDRGEHAREEREVAPSIDAARR